MNEKLKKFMETNADFFLGSFRGFPFWTPETCQITGRYALPFFLCSVIPFCYVQRTWAQYADLFGVPMNEGDQDEDKIRENHELKIEFERYLEVTVPLPPFCLKIVFTS